MCRAVLAAACVVCLTNATAEAQFPFGARPGLPVGGFTTGLYSTNPYLGLNSYNFGYNYSFGFNYVNPATGGRTVFQINQSFVSPGPFGAAALPNPLLNNLGYTIPQFRGGFVNPYLAGQQGYAAPGVNPIAAEQARLARIKTPERAPDRVAPPRVAPPQRPAEAELATPLPQADPDTIASGEAINALIPDIVARLDAGNRTESPLIPSDLLRSLAYAPGDAADLIDLLKDGQPQAPDSFTRPELSVTKAELESLSGPVAKAVLAGKPTNTEESKALAKAVETARGKVGPALKDAAESVRNQADRHLAGLAALAKVDSTQSLKGVHSPSFARIGASATDYARHAAKHDLKLAPAPQGSLGAYEALYRALAATKASLDERAAKR